MSRVIETKIELPSYSRSPPYAASPVRWWVFFLEPYKWPLAFYYSVNLLRQGFFRAQPFFLGVLVGLADTARETQDIRPTLIWIALYAFLSVIAIFSLAFIIPCGRIIDKISKQISLFGFRHYMKLPESWHENHASGEKIQRLLSARLYSFDFMENVLWHVMQIPAVFVAVCFSVAVLNAPFYYILLFFAMVASYTWASHKTSQWMFERFKIYNATLENTVGSVYEFILSTATVRFFNLKNYVLEKGAALEGLNHEARLEIYRTIFKRWLLLSFIGIFWIVVIISLASYQSINGTLAAGAFATIIFLAVSTWWDMENLAVIYARLIEEWEGFKRLIDVLNQKPDITDAPGAKILNVQEGGIFFDNVDFSYNDTSRAVHNFSLDIKPGEKIGLIGPSGAGKTTLVKLLLRFYDLKSGTISIRGQDIAAITLSSLQDNIAVIPQDVVLFNHELMENIRYGRLNATDEEVIEAARQAHADEFIRNLPEGYKTPVGERGVKLSGGQRQRIAIARAILKNAPILVLDEATSALDSESERYIQDSLEAMMQGKTVIAIAHRLSTIAHLDRLVVMDEGRIVEEGTHDELLALEGLYAKLWHMQSGGFLGE